MNELGQHSGLTWNLHICKIKFQPIIIKDRILYQSCYVGKESWYPTEKILIQWHQTTIIFLLEGIQMRIKLEASKYEISEKSFIYLSHTYIDCIV